MALFLEPTSSFTLLELYKTDLPPVTTATATIVENNTILAGCESVRLIIEDTSLSKESISNAEIRIKMVNVGPANFCRWRRYLDGSSALSTILSQSISLLGKHAFARSAIWYNIFSSSGFSDSITSYASCDIARIRICFFQ
jgi:hypothetical protein